MRLKCHFLEQSAKASSDPKEMSLKILLAGKQHCLITRPAEKTSPESEGANISTVSFGTQADTANGIKQASGPGHSKQMDSWWNKQRQTSLGTRLGYEGAGPHHIQGKDDLPFIVFHQNNYAEASRGTKSWDVATPTPCITA